MAVNLSKQAGVFKDPPIPSQRTESKRSRAETTSRPTLANIPGNDTGTSRTAASEGNETHTTESVSKTTPAKSAPEDKRILTELVHEGSNATKTNRPEDKQPTTITAKPPSTAAAAPTHGKTEATTPKKKTSPTTTGKDLSSIATTTPSTPEEDMSSSATSEPEDKSPGNDNNEPDSKGKQNESKEKTGKK